MGRWDSPSPTRARSRSPRDSSSSKRRDGKRDEKRDQDRDTQRKRSRWEDDESRDDGKRGGRESGRDRDRDRDYRDRGDKGRRGFDEGREGGGIKIGRGRDGMMVGVREGIETVTVIVVVETEAAIETAIEKPATMNADNPAAVLNPETLPKNPKHLPKKPQTSTAQPTSSPKPTPSTA
ncbi:uncharacterized protein DFL_006304 [Arthrobotrys flagrans]|uniref:Uncharacterized protein n=1 Tax=Arthrobotrys flagrans TaxID=97331 RepID=A0A436ZZX5_ARTFL|nr:hypothetical protein DFL_006304 [Arthrobotrys flagrans]